MIKLNPSIFVKGIDLTNEVFIVIGVGVFYQHNFAVDNFRFQVAGFKGGEGVFFLRIGNKYVHIGLSGKSPVPDFYAGKNIIRHFITVEIGFVARRHRFAKFSG